MSGHRGGGKANSELIKYSELVASKVAAILTDDPDASISLTGHSMGGAIAQVVGNVGNFRVVSFDAPGVGDVIGDLRQNVLSKFKGLSLPTQADAPTNYRLYGDQVSFAGNPLSNLITKTVDNLASQYSIDSGLLPMGWLAQHDMSKLLGQLEKALGACVPASCPAIMTSAVGQEGPGRNLTKQIIRVKTIAKTQCLLNFYSLGALSDFDYCKLLAGLDAAALTGKVEIQNAIAKVANPIDPGPGWLYSLEVDAGSSPIESITLPLFGDVFGWALRFHNASGWTDDNIWMSEAAFAFPNDVDAFTFMPLGQDGKPIFNSESFVYDLVFSQSGPFSAFQANYGGLSLVKDVPEPGTIYLLLVGAVALLWARRGARVKTLAH